MWMFKMNFVAATWPKWPAGLEPRDGAVSYIPVWVAIPQLYASDDRDGELLLAAPEKNSTRGERSEAGCVPAHATM